jgi:organic radical activating enzyme
LKQSQLVESDIFCTVKWKHASINLQSAKVKSCCHQNFRNWNSENRKNKIQFHDTLEDRFERTQILKGIKPDNCQRCWIHEEKNQSSDRIIWNEKPWIKPFSQNLLLTKPIELPHPSWLEVNFSNKCNLKCSYCSPQFSTAWEKEINSFGPYQIDIPYNYLEQLNYDQKTISEFNSEYQKWFEENYSSLRFLKITGGEPLINNQTFGLLDWIENNRNSELTLSINSNLSIPGDVFHKFLTKIKNIILDQKIKRFTLHVSLDSTYEHAEYIRYGLNYKLLTENIKHYLSTVDGDLVIICTLNNLSLFRLKKLYEYIQELKKTFGTTGHLITIKLKPLTDPTWQSINFLPKKYIKYLFETLTFIELNQGLNYH